MRPCFQNVLSSFFLEKKLRGRTPNTRAVTYFAHTTPLVYKIPIIWSLINRSLKQTPILIYDLNHSTLQIKHVGCCCFSNFVVCSNFVVSLILLFALFKMIMEELNFSQHIFNGQSAM